MILKWGSYTHSLNEVGIRISRRSIFDTFGRRMGEVEDWNILGAVLQNSKANITAALSSLETAYNTSHQDLILYLADGTTETKHKLLNSECFGGTNCTGFGYIDGPWKMRTEYANRRTFWASVRGERRVGTGLYAWKESMTVKGTGGAKWRFMPQLLGVPIAQTLQTDTTYYYVQEGMAVGRETYIAPPGPVYPGIEHMEMREVRYITPKDIRYPNKYELYTTTWRYVMEATNNMGFSAFTSPVVT
jgi:hypothetical protein